MREYRRRSWGLKRNAIRLARHWKARWEADTAGTMRANLDRINGDRKTEAAKRTERLAAILRSMPPTVPSHALADALVAAFNAAGFPLAKAAVPALRVCLWRRRLIRHDPASMTWAILPDEKS
jgi:hypothetical protein